jgi:hypothetical protein
LLIYPARRCAWLGRGTFETGSKISKVVPVWP